MNFVRLFFDYYILNQVTVLKNFYRISLQQIGLRPVQPGYSK